MHILSTERLFLREFTFQDSPFFIELVNSEGWLKFIGDRNVKTIQDAEKYLEERIIHFYKALGFGFYLVTLKDKTPIGLCGLIKRDSLDDVDIGFAFLPQYIGKGYGFEAASATMEFARKTLKLKRVVAITVKENISSIELLKKIGLTEEGPIMQGNEELMLFAANF